ncbi:unnamed protein product, partial [Meganyctiphanes norvegica]
MPEVCTLEPLMSLALLWAAAALLLLPVEALSWSRSGRHVIPDATLPGPTMPPIFDPQLPSNVTVTASKTALLSCVVHNLGNNSVSWIRHRDLHILSVGAVTYTSDSRFEAAPQHGAGDWALKLRYAHPRDSGKYDCQVSTTPPFNRTVHLTVIEPQARILRSPEMHIGLGTTINLTCVIPYSPEPPDYLHWYHKEKVSRKNGRREVPGTVYCKISFKETISKQINGRPKAALIFGCPIGPARDHALRPKGQLKIILDLIDGEHPAAMQGGSSVRFPGHRLWAWTLSIAIAALISRPLLYYFYM